MKRLSLVVLIYFMCGSVGTALALFDSKKELVNSAKLTMAEAIDAAVQAVPGKAVEAYIDKEDDRTVFEVEIISDQGGTKEVYIDAQTGSARKIEHD